jgi:transposase InsO family protein
LYSDNGSECIARDLQEWLKKIKVKPIQIFSGSPLENGYNERSNGTLRREVLSIEWFSNLKRAKIVIIRSLRQYSHIRSHQALNMRSPVPETLHQSGTYEEA